VWRAATGLPACKGTSRQTRPCISRRRVQWMAAGVAPRVHVPHYGYRWLRASSLQSSCPALRQCVLYSCSVTNPALQLTKSASTTPQGPFWNSSGTVGERDFLENGCRRVVCNFQGILFAGKEGPRWRFTRWNTSVGLSTTDVPTSASGS